MKKNAGNILNFITLNNEAISPSKIVCVGRNYVEHAKELGNEIPKEIVFFLKPNSSISDQLCSVKEEPLHYEAELCFIVKDRKLAGVGLGLDLTKRKLQSKLKQASLPWERAKAFDGSAIFSRFVPFEGHTNNYNFRLNIDGKLTQLGCPDHMIFSPNQVIADIQSFMHLQDGDIIMTGTPKGVGAVNKGSQYQLQLFYNEQLLIDQTWLAE